MARVVQRTLVFLLRVTFHLASAVFLILLLALLVLWIRSYWVNDQVRFYPNPRLGCRVQTGNGKFLWYRVIIDVDAGHTAGDPGWFKEKARSVAFRGMYANIEPDFAFLGIEAHSMPQIQSRPLTSMMDFLVVPLWMPALVLAVLPTVWMAYLIRSRRRRRRGRMGLCIACGYDLRGSSASPSCPECGKPITTAITRHLSPQESS